MTHKSERTGQLILHTDIAKNFKQQIGPSEFEMGRGILDAAAKAGIKHVVHASLPAATKLTDGRVSLTAFDGKMPFCYMIKYGM